MSRLLQRRVGVTNGVGRDYGRADGAHFCAVALAVVGSGRSPPQQVSEGHERQLPSASTARRDAVPRVGDGGAGASRTSFI